MKSSGNIVQSNSKGQIVIPHAMRKALGITAATHLHLSQRGQGVYLQPVQDIIGRLPHENYYPAILKETKGAWGAVRSAVRAQRKKIELVASKRRKAVW